MYIRQPSCLKDALFCFIPKRSSPPQKGADLYTMFVTLTAFPRRNADDPSVQSLHVIEIRIVPRAAKRTSGIHSTTSDHALSSCATQQTNCHHPRVPRRSFCENARGQQQTGASSLMSTMVPTSRDTCSKAHSTLEESFIHVMGNVVVV